MAFSTPRCRAIVPAWLSHSSVSDTLGPEGFQIKPRRLVQFSLVVAPFFFFGSRSPAPKAILVATNPSRNPKRKPRKGKGKCGSMAVQRFLMDFSDATPAARDCQLTHAGDAGSIGS